MVPCAGYLNCSFNISGFGCLSSPMLTIFLTTKFFESFSFIFETYVIPGTIVPVK
jgi:hypothetical protein